MKANNDFLRDRLIELIQSTPRKYDGTRNVHTITDHLLDNGVTILQTGEWYKEPLPTPPNAKNHTMEHYRLVCPFCGRRNGKKREKFCADCGARLR